MAPLHDYLSRHRNGSSLLESVLRQSQHSSGYRYPSQNFIMYIFRHYHITRTSFNHEIDRIKPMNTNVCTSPYVEGRAAYVNCETAAVKHMSLKQSLKKQLEPITRPLVKKLEPITRPLLPPFVVSTSNPYPADTDVPAVRAAKAVVRLGRPKKLQLMKNEGLDMYPPSPLVRNPTSLVQRGAIPDTNISLKTIDNVAVTVAVQTHNLYCSCVAAMLQSFLV
ncbi:hypothetical protein CPB85DRAFT_1255304 [Mucidula mucida]|nr:hypothetical protein CPB85DRAFT_1255304 [Mucidula mucida]